MARCWSRSSWLVGVGEAAMCCRAGLCGCEAVVAFEKELSVLPSSESGGGSGEV